MKKRFDLIIFDWDGTLINSIDWIVNSFQQSAAACGCRIPKKQAAREVIGLSIGQAVVTLFPDADEETRNNLIRYYNSVYYSRELDREDLFPGVYEMLIQLCNSGYRLAVATGKTRAGLERVLRTTGMKDLFFTTRCADETASKPDPRMLNDIMRTADTPNTRALMIGDTVHDLQMAYNAKIRSIAVTCGAQSEILLQHYQPLACIKQPTDLMNFIEG